ncbi:MAG: glycosyltransferase family 87 protein [Pirellulales bacterium]
MHPFHPLEIPTSPLVERLPTWEEHRRRQWLWVTVVIALVVWGLTDVRHRARVEPDDPAAHKTDLTVYTEAGAAFFDGRDPYEATNPRGWHYLYPPLFALLVAPLSAFDTQTQALVWYFVSVAACYGLWRECRRVWQHLAHADDAPPAWLGAIAAAAVALPALNCLQRGQVGVVLVYLLLLGLRLVLTSATMRGVALGGVVLALPVTIKLTPLLPVGFLALLLLATAWWRQRSYATALADGLARGPLHRALATIVGQVAGLALFVFLLPGSLLGHRENLTHLATWVSRVAANDDVGVDNHFNARSKRNQSLTNAVRRLGNRLAFATGTGPDDRLVDDLANQRMAMPMETPLVDHALRAAVVALLVLLVFAGWGIALRGDVATVAALFGLACTASLAVSPISWGHHYVMWLPGLVFVPHWLWQNGRRALAIGLAETACVLVIAHYLVLDHSGRVGLLGLGLTIWYVVGAISVCRSIRADLATDAPDNKTVLPGEAAPSQRRAA